MFLALLAAVVILFFIWWRVVFLRDPERIIPSGANVVSPCDGKVVRVMPYDEKVLRVQKGVLGKIRTLTKEVGPKGTLVSIFMSPFVVHVTRSPLDGKVLSVKHASGKLLPVFDLEAGLQNEKVEYLMQNKIGKYKVILMAGFLARRIIPWVKKGDQLKKGQRNGLINLGSQVTCLFPPKVKITIKEGECVIAGESIIGKL